MRVGRIQSDHQRTVQTHKSVTSTFRQVAVKFEPASREIRYGRASVLGSEREICQRHATVSGSKTTIAFNEMQTTVNLEGRNGVWISGGVRPEGLLRRVCSRHPRGYGSVRTNVLTADVTAWKGSTAANIGGCSSCIQSYCHFVGHCSVGERC